MADVLAEMDGEQTWDERLQPTMIGVENGRVYVVGRPRGSQQFERYVYPRYVYVAFLWNGHDFSRVPFMSVPAHLRTKENVRWCLPGGRDSRIGFAKRVTASAPWCIWPSAGATENPFPRPQVVDLEVRMREAERWASQDGHRPSSE